jgi:hypothetical protein
MFRILLDKGGKMPMPSDLIELLRKALAEVGQVRTISPEDLTLLEVKHSILQAIAKLELARRDKNCPSL